MTGYKLDGQRTQAAPDKCKRRLVYFLDKVGRTGGSLDRVLTVPLIDGRFVELLF